MSASLICQDCGNEFLAKRSDTLRCSSCIKIHRKNYLQEYEHGKERGSCVDCGKNIGKRSERCVSCGNTFAASKRRGSNNSNWKKGRTRDKSGYVYIRVSPEPGGAGSSYKAEHVLVWESINGSLPKGYIVHHYNGIKDDNRSENLFAMSRKDHGAIHTGEHYKIRIRELESQLRELQLNKGLITL